jgi:tetratricopeptide (TPR) repeat protein
LANVQNAQGNWQLAINKYQQVLDRSPDWFYARLNLALILTQRGEHRKALKLLDAVEQVALQHLLLKPRWHIIRCQILLNLQDKEGAEDACKKALESGMFGAEGLAILGTTLSLVGKHDEALTVLHKAIMHAPVNSKLLTILGQILISKHANKEAIAKFQEAIRHNPANANAHLALGLGLAREMNYADAEIEVRKAIKLQPHDSLHQSTLGTVLLVWGKYKDAIGEFDKAIQLNSANWQAHSGLGQAYFSQGRYMEAIRFLKNAVELQPRNAAQHEWLGYARIKFGNFAEGIPELLRAAELDPKSSSAHVKLLEAYWQAGRDDEVIKTAPKAIELDPQNHMVHYLLARALDRKGQLDEVLPAYREAVRLAPYDAVSHNNVGYALYRKKQFADASTSFQKATRLARRNAFYYYWLGEALFCQKKYAEAADAVRRALDRDVGNATYHNALANTYYNFGDVLFEKKDYAEAAKAIAEAVKHQPHNANFHIALATSFRFARDFKRAEDAARKAIAVDSKTGAAHNVLGSVFFAQGRHEEAIPLFREATSLSPKNAVYHVNLGDSLRMIKDVKGALIQFRLALEIDPGYLYALSSLLKLYEYEGNFVQAEPLLKKSLEIKRLVHDKESSQVGYALAVLGMNLLNQQKYEVATPIWQECLKLRQAKEADDWKTFNTKAMLGRCVLSQKNYAEAEKLLLSGYEGMVERQAKIPSIGRIRVIEALEALVQLYEAWEKKDESAKWRKKREAADGYRYEAACYALLAADGKGMDHQKANEKQKGQLRAHALKWLRAELQQTEDVLLLIENISNWKNDVDLASVREQKPLALLPADEQAAWRKFWADADEVLKQANARIPQLTLTQVGFKAALSSKEFNQTYDVKLAAGKTYIIDMESPEFDCYLKLLDHKQAVVKENDDVAPGNLNSRIIYTPKTNGDFQIVATSFQGQGTGAYTLTIRALAGKSK